MKFLLGPSQCLDALTPIKQSLQQPVAEARIVSMAELEIRVKRGKVEDSRDIYLLTVHRSNQGSTTIPKKKKT